MECYEGWAEEEADYYGWCHRHPSQPRHSVCAACLRDRLSLLCLHCARPRPCRICEPSSSSSFSAASSSTAMTFDATSSSTTSSDLSLDAAAAIGLVAPMSHFLGEPSFRRSRSAACGRGPPGPPPGDRPRLAPPAEEGKPPRSSVSSSSASFLLFWRSSVKKGEAKGRVAEGLYRSRTVAGGDRGGCQREAAAAEMKGRGWNFRSPMKAFRLSKAEKMLPRRPPLCKG